MSKIHIISIPSIVHMGRFSYTFQSPFFRLFMMHCVLENPNGKKQNKTKQLTKNYSAVSLQHPLTRKLSSRIWFSLVIIQTSIEDPPPQKLTWLSHKLAPELLNHLANHLKLGFQSQSFCSGLDTNSTGMERC